MTYTKDNLRQIFQQPFNQEGWQNMLRHYFHASELRAERERIDDTPDDEKGYYLGAIDTTDNYRIGLFYYQILHGNVARKRVGLRNLVKSFINPNWGEFDAALVVFDSSSAKIENSKFVNGKSTWRLSFVSDIKGESTAPKRYTYVFGESDSFYNTPVGRFDALQRKGISFENIKDAFSVEALSDEFYEEFDKLYSSAPYNNCEPGFIEEFEANPEMLEQFLDKSQEEMEKQKKPMRDYVKKLMGRLVFMQFLQKKGWLGVPSNSEGWSNGNQHFLQDIFQSSKHRETFLDDVLEPIFFEYLNTPYELRKNKYLSIEGKEYKVPYLNGGLFEQTELDRKESTFSIGLFQRLFDLFDRYNFTIDENDPDDFQVSVDPEMLGRIFENQLEDNNDKGAFYTPKFIVQEMCKDCLIAVHPTNA